MSKRIFVGNISESTTAEDLQKEFSAYGKIQNVDLKVKHNSLNDTTNYFAFITLIIDSDTLEQCIQEFSQEPVKGAYLKVSEAKESFLEKLKREREEAALKQPSKPAVDPVQEDAQQQKSPAKKPAPALPTLKETSKSSSESSSSESEEEVEVKPVRPVRKQEPIVKIDDGVVRKYNKDSYIEKGRLKIVSITGEIKEIIDKTRKPRELDARGKAADDKRKDGLNKIKEAYDQQKLAIKSALSNVDSGKKNKIIFADDGTALKPTGQQAKKQQKLQAKQNASKRPTLFQDEDDEDNDNYRQAFAVKEQFQGAKGEKLFQLQSKFQNDDRFAMNKNFVEDDDNQAPQKKRPRTGHQNEMDDEQQQQMEILESVMGRPVQQVQRNNEVVHKTMMRFDPTRKDHSKFIQQGHATAGRDDVDDQEEAENEGQAGYKVDANKFYKVSDNLTQALRKDEGFSLLGMLGRTELNGDDEPDEEYRETPITHKTSIGLKKFKYDSSDSEDDTKKSKSKKPEAKAKAEKPKKSKKSKAKLTRTKFFMFSTDERLTEGLKFFSHEFDLDEERQLLGHLRKEVRAGLRKKRFKVLRKNNKDNFHVRPRRMGKGKPLIKKNVKT